jgi:ABC-type transporter Mla subunit MlaD
VSIEQAIIDTKEAISRLERLAGGESTTPDQIAAGTEAIKACMEKLAGLSTEDTQAHREALSNLRHHLDNAMTKLTAYQKSVKEQIQTNAIRAKANKQYGGPSK